MRCTILLLLAVFGTALPHQSSAQSRAELYSNFSSDGIVPLGCLPYAPSALEIPFEPQLLYEELLNYSDLFGSSTMWVRAWRVGCYEPDRSIIILNLDEQLGGGGLLYPEVVIRLPDGREVPAVIDLIPRSKLSANLFSNTLLSAQKEYNFENGLVFVINSFSETLSQEDYNGELELGLRFGSSEATTIPIPAFDTERDFPADQPSLHGRFSGQWIASGLPRSGLVLQIGEVPPDRNFVFAIWFTYEDGNPAWYAGNADISVGADSVEIPLQRFEGGNLATLPGSYLASDVSGETVGQMLILPVHCNQINVNLDLSESGQGQVFLELSRLVRIAGYDCDQTQ